MNRTVEDELPRLLRGSDIHLHWSRALPAILPGDRSDESYLPALIADLPAALERLAPADLNAIVFACTSAAVDLRLEATLLGPVQVSAFDCLLDAARRLEQPCLLCTPYSTALTKSLVDSFERRGVSIASVARIISTLQYRDITEETIAATIAASLSDDIRSIVVSCTALYTTHVDDVLQRLYSINLPLISSNIAIAEFLKRLCHQYVPIKPS